MEKVMATLASDIQVAAAGISQRIYLKVQPEIAMHVGVELFHLASKQRFVVTQPPDTDGVIDTLTIKHLPLEEQTQHIPKGEELKVLPVYLGYKEKP